MNPFKLFLAALWVLGARRRALLRALAPALFAHGAFALWSALAPEAALAALPGASGAPVLRDHLSDAPVDLSEPLPPYAYHWLAWP